MFGIDLQILAFIILVGITAFALAFSFLFNRVSAERIQEKRVLSIKNADGDREARLKAESRLAEASKRKQTLQSSLKELEEKTKERDPSKVGLKEQLRQAGMSISTKQFYLLSFGFGIVFGFLVLIFFGNIYAALAGLVIGIFGLPRWFLGFKRKRRMQAFLEEFPNAVDAITRGIKAGLPLIDCLNVIASESKDPVKAEFKKILEAQQLGLPMSEAILKLYRNVPLTEANFFGIVVSIQQSSGGNLSEALSNLSKVLRDRKKMQAKIKAMSAEAKASAGIIGSLPIVVTLLIYITTPAYISLLFTEQTGHFILLGSGIWMFCGIMVMRSMINFDF